MFVETFNTYFIQADFYLNRAYIARNLCVNKDKPMMHCNGKCYLSKKLKQQDQDQSPMSRVEKFDVQPFFVPTAFSLDANLKVLPLHFFTENEDAISCVLPAPFHPPTA